MELSRELADLRKAESDTLKRDLARPSIVFSASRRLIQRKDLDRGNAEKLRGSFPEATRESLEQAVVAANLVRSLPDELKSSLVAAFVAGSVAKGTLGSAPHFREHAYYRKGNFQGAAFEKLESDQEAKRRDLDLYLVLSKKPADAKHVQRALGVLCREHPDVNFDLNLVHYEDLLEHIQTRPVSNYRGILGASRKIVIKGAKVLLELEKKSRTFFEGHEASLDFQNELDIRVRKAINRLLSEKGVLRARVPKRTYAQMMPYLYAIRTGRPDLGDHRSITIKVKEPPRNFGVVQHNG